ncbi:MarR family transcriptional regulator [Streptomyces sp. NPDC088354]|uniref:MarR family transcriptional regulator n=1 Tax=Streptomyces sp. NPDC088354 TaxID=3365856 RepID=UPI0037F817C0
MADQRDDAPRTERRPACFAPTEAVGMPRHTCGRQARAGGGLGCVRFRLPARLSGAVGSLTTTELADGVVHGRGGLTCQADLRDEAGPITRAPGPDDERPALVTITHGGRACPARVLPGPVQVARQSREKDRAARGVPAAGPAGHGEPEGTA